MYFHIIEHELVGCAGFSVTSEVTTTVGLATILMTYLMRKKGGNKGVFIG
ncbi:14567_t:CDS:2 [Rhizophagus irregularis]|nr:14567_t:CDS:2 [Rhizophagus irregularis]